MRLHRTVLVAIAALFSVNVYGNGQQHIQASSIGGSAPVIDGAVTSGEWPWPPQITITNGYVASNFSFLTANAPAYATFANSATDLFIFVDLPGDTSNSSGDECLFWFGGGTTHVALYLFGNGTTDSLGGARAAGFGATPNSATPHRFFEIRVPLSALDVPAGAAIDISSPYFKTGGGSMGYDAATGNDNVWPPALDTSNPSDHSTWAVLDPAPMIPTLSDAALAMLAIAMTAAGLLALRR